MSVNRKNFDTGSSASSSTTSQSVGVESREKLKNLTPASEVLPVQINPDNPLPQPFLLLQVNMEESSDITKRRSFPEFAKREPVCLEWRNVVNPADTNFISLIVTNLGQVASDAVRIHYQFVYCTYRDHARDQGFTIDHAFEAKSDEKSFFVDFVPASGNRVFLIPYPIDTTSFPELKNLYFRARVSTLWEAKVPIENWDFATDLKVTEATKVFP